MKRHIFITAQPGAGKTTLIKKILSSISSTQNSSSNTSSSSSSNSNVVVSSAAASSKAVTTQQTSSSNRINFNEKFSLLPGSFITEEIRSNKTRTGFQFIFDQSHQHLTNSSSSKEKDLIPSTSIPLAVVTDSSNEQQQNAPKVGKYSVCVENLENVVVPVLQHWIQISSSSNNNNKMNLVVLDEIGKMECNFSQSFCSTLIKLLDDKNITVIATIALRGTRFIESLKFRNDVEILEMNEGNRNAQVDVVMEKLLTR